MIFVQYAIESYWKKGFKLILNILYLDVRSQYFQLMGEGILLLKFGIVKIKNIGIPSSWHGPASSMERSYKAATHVRLGIETSN